MTPEVKKFFNQCIGHREVFAKTFFPEKFYKPFSQLHREIISAMDAGHKKIVVAAPRGMGKTALAHLEVMYGILFGGYTFITYITNSADSAILQCENIKWELRTNPFVKKLWGDISTNIDDPDVDVSFSTKAWVAFGKTLVLPRGMGQQMRGLNYHNHRPELIVIDDLEKREEIHNPEIRAKIHNWFSADVEKCIDQYRGNYRFLYIDTLKHEDSLLQRLLDSPDWYSLRLELCDDNGNTNIPELFSTEECIEEIERHRRNGELHIFLMEYRNLITNSEIASFKQEYFQYYEDVDLQGKRLEHFVIVDPAKTAELHNAESAIVGISVDFDTHRMYIRDIVNGHMQPDELYEETFAMRRRLGAKIIGVEVTGIEEFIRQPFVNEMSRRGPRDFAEFVWLKARGGSDGEKGKHLRIRALVPYYRQGFVVHNRAACTALETQLLSFPRGKRIDVADATAYIVELLSIGERYFTPPEISEEEIEREYEGLYDEEPLNMDEFQLI